MFKRISSYVSYFFFISVNFFHPVPFLFSSCAPPYLKCVFPSWPTLPYQPYRLYTYLTLQLLHSLRCHRLHRQCCSKRFPSLSHRAHDGFAQTEHILNTYNAPFCRTRLSHYQTVFAQLCTLCRMLCTCKLGCKPLHMLVLPVLLQRIFHSRQSVAP